MSLLGLTMTDTITGGKTLELSAYDKVRVPHPAATSNDEIIKIGVRTLATELTCPICLDLLNTTMTTKECLHRFCDECISKALQRGNRECPTCRKKIVSKRSLRRDENVDALINTLWSDREVYENMQSAGLESCPLNPGFEALRKSIEAGIKAQAANRRQRVTGSYDYDRRKRKTGNKPKGSTNGSGDSTPDVDMEASVEGDDRSELDDDRSRVFDFTSDISDNSDESESSSEVSSDSSMLSFASSDFEMEPNIRKSLAGSVEGARLVQKSLPGCRTVKQTFENLLSAGRGKGVFAGNVDTTQSTPIRSHSLNDSEIELAPTILLQKRSGVPPICLISHYIRIPDSATIGHLAGFIPQRCEQLMEEDGFDASQVKQGTIKPQFFYVMTQDRKLRSLDLSDSICSAVAKASKESEHPIIFYDISEIAIVEQRGRKRAYER